MKIQSAEFEKSAVNPVDFPPADLPEIAFAGRSNVGKSSLINALVGRRKLAQTSRTPGKTRLINFFVVNGKFRLVDLPGYGYAKVPAAVRREWSPMVERYLAGRESLKALALLIDCRRGPEEEERALIDWCAEHGLRLEIVITKSDKLGSNDRRNLQRHLETDIGLPPEHFTFTSSSKGTGIADLQRKLSERVSDS
ncbi:MAG: ribosome biogenesis GTP-binding protein YihA/YsxC [Deltaproteobacteria bacterium]|nr:ribosome biogenesis GTP-binding protein YihA/YsxC [Deltaproteobacteria bacterium]